MKRRTCVRMRRLAVVALVWAWLAPGASARLFAGYDDNRLSLIAEAAWATSQSVVDGDQGVIWIPDATRGAAWVGDWQYPASDVRAYLVLAESPLGKENLMTDFTRFSAMSPSQIQAFVARQEQGWGGQCLSFVSLLLLRSGCVSDNQLLLSYAQLKAVAEDLSAVQQGDILFKDEVHAAVVLQVDPNGLVVGDSNFVTGGDHELIGMHFMPWSELGGYRAAGLDRLLQSLTRNSPPRPGPCTNGSAGVSALQETPTDTGIDVVAGERVTIQASGIATYGQDGSPCGTGDTATDPDGNRYLGGNSCRPKYDPASVQPSAPIGALLARIGAGPWFMVGSNYSGVASRGGRLFLLYNDDPGLYYDNGGGYSAAITVCGGGDTGGGGGPTGGAVGGGGGVVAG